ncbi:MAG: ferritin [Alistipes sp.]|jgi:ferritin|nr:ferritin [Alistipes sp.]MBQ1980526.1 ferritin [Alistipes sp.]
MISKRMQDAINAQINAELWSAYLYLSMSMDAADKGLKGVANWFAIQFKEEQDHAQIFINYMHSQGARVELAPIAAVDTSWESAKAMFEQTLTHEQKVTSLIHNLCAIAAEEKDVATANRLAWFVDEQVEEEESARDIIDQLRMVEGNNYGLYMIDKEMAARVYTTPSPLAAKE